MNGFTRMLGTAALAWSLLAGPAAAAEQPFWWGVTLAGYQNDGGNGGKPETARPVGRIGGDIGHEGQSCLAILVVSGGAALNGPPRVSKRVMRWIADPAVAAAKAWRACNKVDSASSMGSWVESPLR